MRLERRAIRFAALIAALACTRTSRLLAIGVEEAILSDFGLAGPAEVVGGAPVRIYLAYTVDLVHLLGTVTTLSVDDPLGSPMPPTSVQQPAFQTRVEVDVPTLAVRQREVVTVTAEDGGVVLRTRFTVLPPSVSALDLLPPSVEGGSPLEGRVRLSSKSSPLGAVVALSSSDAGAVVLPGEVAVSPGATEVKFPIHARAVSAAASVKLTASFAGSSRTATLSITPPRLVHLELDEPEATGGEAMDGIVVISSPAPPGGIRIALKTGDPSAASVPPGVMVPAGSDEGRFSVTTGLVSAPRSISVTASLRGAMLQDALTLLPAQLVSVTLVPAGMMGGRAGSGRVDLNGAASPAGARVTLSSSRPDLVSVPPEVGVLPGNRSARFDITTAHVLGTEQVDIAAVLGPSTQTATLTLVASRKGDRDGDGDVDMADFASFQTCFRGPRSLGLPAPPADCRSAFDFDEDADVDHDDFLAMEAELDEDAGASRPRVELDTSIVPTVTQVPGWTSGAPRPVAAIVDGAGRQSELVTNEIIIVSDDAGEVSSLIARWNGVEVKSFRPRDAGINAPAYHVVRVDSSRADAASLEDRLSDLSPGTGGLIRVSSAAAAQLLAVAAEEARRGLTVGVNWVSRSAAIRDRSTPEAPSTSRISGYSANSFDWSFLRRHRVPDAWRALDLAGRLGNKVKLAVLDGGFAADGDWQGGDTRLATVPVVSSWGARNFMSCSGSPCPWHGTNVTSIALGMAGNGFGAAGVAGPVGAAPITVQTLGDMATSIISLTLAMGAGARIINMSFGVPVPATLSWSVIPFNVATKLARATDHLLFASAGNNGENVDDEDCFIVCWESTWHTPCENDGVICVGGTGSDGRSRDPGSNYGAEEVDIYAPFTVWIGPDPDVRETQMASGTSFSSPYAAGVAALIWAANPNLGGNEVEDILLATARPGIGDVNRVVSAYDAVIRAMGSQPPSVRIFAPENGRSYPELLWGLDILFFADAFDPEDGEPEVIWTSSLQGEIGRGIGFTRRDLVPGTHVITARAVDSDGVSSTDSVTITVHRVAPDVWILKPYDSATYFEGEAVVLQAESFDRAGNGFRLPDSAVRWTSSVDGSLGSGHVVTRTLHRGTHTITFAGTDAAGTTSEARVAVVVNPPRPNPPPTVVITKPADAVPRLSNRQDFLHRCVLDVVFEGSAIDNNTGLAVPDANMVWVTDRTDLQDAIVGTGRSFEGTLVQEGCNIETIHHVTLAATDSKGTTAASSPVTVVIARPPQ